jgi:hypothetical protein
MIEQGLRPHKVIDKHRNVEILLLLSVPLGPDKPWGVLSPLQGTVWERLIPVVPSGAYEEAQRGDVGKLCQYLRNPPRQLAKRFPLSCKYLQDKSCLIRSERKCIPGGGQLPFCYAAPLINDERVPEDVLTAVMKAWDEGRHVFVLSSSVG